MEELIEIAKTSPEVKEILQHKLVLINKADLSTRADLVPSLVVENEAQKYALEMGGRVMDKMELEIECQESTISELTKKIGTIDTELQQRIKGNMLRFKVLLRAADGKE